MDKTYPLFVLLLHQFSVFLGSCPINSRSTRSISGGFHSLCRRNMIIMMFIIACEEERVESLGFSVSYPPFPSTFMFPFEVIVARFADFPVRFSRRRVLLFLFLLRSTFVPSFFILFIQTWEMFAGFGRHIKSRLRPCVHIPPG